MDSQTTIQVTIGVMVVLLLAASILGAKSWRIPQVLLVAAIFFAATTFYYLAAGSVFARRMYGQQVNDLVVKVAELQRANEALRVGTSDEQLKEKLNQENLTLRDGGLRRVDTNIYKYTIDRGRVWSNVTPTGVDPKGTVTVTFGEDAATPHLIEEGMPLFVFEQGALKDGARYHGEFKVTGVEDKAIKLTPTMELSQNELRALGRKTPWILYEVMPVDRHEWFAGLEEAELKELLPAQRISADSFRQYARNGKLAEPSDPEDRVVKFKEDGSRATEEEEEAKLVKEKRYVRPLRDYAMLFRELDRQMFIEKNLLEKANEEAAQLKDADKRAHQDIAKRTAEKNKLKSDLARFEEERIAVDKHLKSLEAVVTRVQADVDGLMAGNRRLAAELAQIQATIGESGEPAPAATPAPATTTATPVLRAAEPAAADAAQLQAASP